MEPSGGIYWGLWIARGPLKQSDNSNAHKCPLLNGRQPISSLAAEVDDGRVCQRRLTMNGVAEVCLYWGSVRDDQGRMSFLELSSLICVRAPSLAMQQGTRRTC